MLNSFDDGIGRESDRRQRKILGHQLGVLAKDEGPLEQVSEFPNVPWKAITLQLLQSVRLIGLPGTFISRAIFDDNIAQSTSMSSFRSRKGGSWIGSTANR